MLYLVAEALFSENIKTVTVKNQETQPAEFCFNVVCTSCREEHDSPITINTFEKHEMPGSKGETSFLLKCKFCSKDCSINISKMEELYYNSDNSENSEEIDAVMFQRKKKNIKGVKRNQCIMLELDCRGCEVVKFFISSVTYTVTLNNKKLLEFEFEDGENEWYDYDDDSAEEVAITEFNTEILKGK